jgi:hypothetical protein
VLIVAKFASMAPLPSAWYTSNMAIVDTPETDASRERRYRQAAELLRTWMADDAGYDQQVGDALEQELANGVMHCQDDDEPVA